MLKSNRTVSLGDAAGHDFSDRCELLILNGADVNEQFKKETPLLRACKGSAWRAAKVLLCHPDIDLDVRDRKNKRTPLHIACENGDFKMARALVSRGANIEAKNQFSEFPLQSAEICGHSAKDFVGVFEGYHEPLEKYVYGSLRPVPRRQVYVWESNAEVERQRRRDDADRNEAYPRAAVIDLGTCYTKAGAAGGRIPWVMQRTIVSETRRKRGTFVSWGTRASLTRKTKGVDLRRPVSAGLIENWNAAKYILERAIQDSLGTEPRDQTLCLIQPSGTTSQYRKHVAEMAFESMSVPNLHFGLHATLALYSSGRCTGCVVDCGDGTTSIVPIFRAVEQRRSRRVSVLSGSVLTDFMIDIFRKRSILKSENDEYEEEGETKEERENRFKENWRHMIRPLAEHMKRFHTNCAFFQREEEMNMKRKRSSIKSKETSPIGIPEEIYTLPDGNIFKIGIERQICGEIMFNPSLVPAMLSSRLKDLEHASGQTRLRREQLSRSQHDAVHHMVASSISSCSSSMRKDLSKNVFVSGGCAEMKGFSSRLKRELSNVLRNAKFDVVKTSPDTTFSRVTSQTDAWRGGSMFASLSTFSGACLSREEFDEVGSDGLERFSF